ncbi:type I restriction enzyme, S subunit [Cnuella takakiae]|uniref:Type I restriction enzyme, S subunit n=1 Tax=Cnuella takakiae TaxID=1302690 RepID=A0A1M5HQW0_9BACT|nr:type I restriction enzyme, S subunit [Cnuella takakiae]
MLQRGKLVTRWDPNYVFLFDKFIRALKECKAPLVKLRRVATFIQYGSSSLATKTPVGLPIVRMNNLKDDDWNFNDIKYILLPKKEQQTWTLNKGDILFNRTNSKELVGKCAVWSRNDKWVFASYLIRVVLDGNKMLPEFATAFLSTKLGRMQIDAVSRQIAGMTNINSEEIRAFILPCPKIGIQKQVKDLITEAVEKRKKTEQQAAALLASIDDFLLSGLGVVLPRQDDETIQSRMFKTNWQKVTSGRIDALYNQAPIYGGIENTHYPFVPLGIHTQYMQPGFAAGRSDQDETAAGWIQIRPTNIGENRDLVFEKTIRILPNSIKNSEREKIKDGEVLFNNTNSQELVGKSAYFNLERPFFCSNHITRICSKPTLHPVFLTHIFNLYQRRRVFYKYCINWNNQSGINNDLLRRLHIPLPPIEKQKQIAAEIEQIRQQARFMFAEALNQFEATKKEIEKLILS